MVEFRNGGLNQAIVGRNCNCAWHKPEEYPPLRIVHFSGEAFTAGVETHHRPGGAVRVYSAAKTVADGFKFRNRIGLDVAIEALREGWQQRRFTLDELNAMAPD